MSINAFNHLNGSNKVSTERLVIFQVIKWFLVAGDFLKMNKVKLQKSKVWCRFDSFSRSSSGATKCFNLFHFYAQLNFHFKAASISRHSVLLLMFN